MSKDNFCFLETNKNEILEEDLAKLCDWVNKKGWELQFDKYLYDSANEFEKTITICSRFGLEKQLFSLLHECGHLLIRKNLKRFKENYPIQARSEAIGKNKQLERTKKYKIDIVSEEYEAWHRGLKLAKKLNLRINEKKYFEHMSECIYSYFEWAVKKT